MKNLKIMMIALVIMLSNQVAVFNASEFDECTKRYTKPNHPYYMCKASNGKMDYKKYFSGNQLVKYEDWNDGKLVKIITYKNTKVSTKTIFQNGKKARYEEWNNGRRTQIVNYNPAGRMTTRYYFKNGKKVRFIKYYTNIKYQVNEQSVIESDYRYKNRKKLKLTKNFANGLPKRVYTYYSNGKPRNVTSYSSRGKKLKRVTYNKRGKVTNTWKAQNYSMGKVRGSDNSCYYSSEDEAWEYAEYQFMNPSINFSDMPKTGLHGFGVYPCAKGTYEVAYY